MRTTVVASLLLLVACCPNARDNGPDCTGLCTALGYQACHEDGTYDLLAHGQERCEVSISRIEQVPEPGGEPRPLYYTEERPAPLGRDDPNAEAVAAWDAVDTFRDYAGKRFRGDAEDEIDAHLPDDPFYQASFVCANILVPPSSKQSLLEARSLRERLDLARALMQERMEPRARARRRRA